VRIEPLSTGTLQGALEVLDKVFGDPEDKIWYTRAFTLSLQDNPVLDEGPVSLEYFVAIDECKVVGTTGLYAYEKDAAQNIYSIGWFGVDPAYRGRGIGHELLEFTIKEAIRRDAPVLNLWTTDSPKLSKARQMYERRGFIVTETEQGEYDYPTVYMTLKLRQ
jgi:GNAT superfamily N-acetyltransferase